MEIQQMKSKVVQLVTKKDTDTYLLIEEALIIYDDYLHSQNDLGSAIKVRSLIDELRTLRKERII